MNIFIFWLLPGMLATVALFWLFNEDGIKQLTVGDVLIGIGGAVMGTMLGWLTVFMAASFSYDEFDLGDIVVWKKKKKKPLPKPSDADILDDLLKLAAKKPSLKQQLIEKLTVEKPIKGLEE